MKIIGLYKTSEAAAKAKRLMRERGVPDQRTSLLSPDDTHGQHLAAYPHHQAARFAWLGAGFGAFVGAVAFGVSTSATLEGLPLALDGHVWSALIGLAIVAPIGALVGAVMGWRRPVLRADFFDADAKRGGTALGVVAETAEELEAAPYAFRATGALRVESGRGQVQEPQPT